MSLDALKYCIKYEKNSGINSSNSQGINTNIYAELKQDYA